MLRPMSDAISRAAREIIGSQLAYRAHTEALARFKAACDRADWPAAETARIEVLTTLEAYLDGLVAAGRGLRG